MACVISSKMAVEIAATTLEDTKPMALTRDIGPSSEPHPRTTQGYKHLRKVNQHKSCNDAWFNKVHGSIASTSGPIARVRELSTVFDTHCLMQMGFKFFL